MAKTISKKLSLMASASKPSGKPPTGDKTLGLEKETCFQYIEDGDETEEAEEAEIPLFQDSSLAESKQNLINRIFLKLIH